MHLRVPCPGGRIAVSAIQGRADAVSCWLRPLKGISFVGPGVLSWQVEVCVVESEKCRESWLRFMATRFLPQFGRDIRARLMALALGLLTAVLVLVAQLRLGIINGNVHYRMLSILWPYALVVFCVVAFHAARTPWRISNDHLASIMSAESANAALRCELDDRKRIAPRIDVRPTAVYRIPSDPRLYANAAGERSWELFLWARVELKEPSKVSILRYVLKLSLHGMSQSSFDMRDDLHAWELTKWSPKTPTTHALFGLPTQLKIGEPVEGWLHFSVPNAAPRALDDSSIILIADTGHGSGYGETMARPDMWNPDNNTRFGGKT
jgi:hypothetical protein